MSGFDIGTLAQGAATDIIGAGIGQWIANKNDQRQINQQQQLTDMQVKAQKDLTDYNRQSSFTQWLNTNYGAQKAQLESAGLNPALMYGQGGGGGVTANVTPGSVTGGQAPHGGHEQIEGIQMGMGLQMQQAQIEVMKSQAELNKATAAKTAGVDTDLTAQNVDNARQAFDNTKLDMTMKNILNFEQQASQGDRLDYIEYQTKSAVKQAGIIANQKQLSDETLNQQISIIQQQATEAALKNILLDNQITNVQADTIVKQESVKKMANDILVNWGQLNVNQKNQKVEELAKTMAANNPSLFNVIGRELNTAIDNIYNATGKERKTMTKDTGPKQ